MKTIKALIALLMIMTFTGCGSKTEEQADTLENYYGIWKAYQLEGNGSLYTISELEALGRTDYSEFYLVIKEGGNAYAKSVLTDEDQMMSWNETEEGIDIDYINASITDKGYLKLDSNPTIYFKKYSSSQDITRIPQKKTEEDNKQNQTPSKQETEKQPEKKTGISKEFKETMDAYEKFMDEYVTFMKKYNSSKDVSSMLVDYMSFLAKYADYTSKIDKLGNSEMTDEEALYYAEVNLRISQKLLTIQ